MDARRRRHPGGLQGRTALVVVGERVVATVMIGIVARIRARGVVIVVIKGVTVIEVVRVRQRVGVVLNRVSMRLSMRVAERVRMVVDRMCV